MATTLEIQRRLAELGYAPGSLDGKEGPKTTEAIKQFQRARNLVADGEAGPKTLAELFPVKVTPAPAPSGKFDSGSARRLAAAHPLLQLVMNTAREWVPFTILDSQRGRAAQEAAFRAGNSKAHFGQSAHNWSPAIAVDIAPMPLDWNDRKAFIGLSKIILPLAKEMHIPLRWGGDWNMNGILTDEKLSDLPHYELHPWREFAADCKPFTN